MNQELSFIQIIMEPATIPSSDAFTFEEPGSRHTQAQSCLAFSLFFLYRLVFC